MRTLLLALAPALLILGPALASCQPAPPSPTLAPNQVVIFDYAFSPNTLNVAQGTTVTWTNNDSDLHTVTATEGAFDSEYINIGDSFSYTFTESGTYEYYCFVHPTMLPARVVVDFVTGPLPESRAILSPKTISQVNLALQVLLVALVVVAAYLARRARFNGHCLLIKVAMFFQAVSIALVMFPSMLAHLERGRSGPLFTAEVMIHAVLGLAIFIIFILVNLVLSGVTRLNVRPKLLMRAAFVLWLTAFLIGLHLFTQF